MKIIVLDFTDWKVKIVNNISENIQVDEAEKLLYEKYNFKKLQMLSLSLFQNWR